MISANLEGMIGFILERKSGFIIVCLVLNLHHFYMGAIRKSYRGVSRERNPIKAE